MEVEPKACRSRSTTGHPPRPPTPSALGDEEAARSGLVARPAKMSVELHPPIAADKGTVLEALAGGLGAVCFGATTGATCPRSTPWTGWRPAASHALRVAVASDEAPGRAAGPGRPGGGRPGGGGRPPAVSADEG